MYGANRRWSIRDGLMTVAAVWLAMSVAGFAAVLVPSSPARTLVSLLVYTALLAAYARWTRTGRRSAGTYFLAGLFPPLICFIILTLLLPHSGAAFFEYADIVLFAGLNIGFQFHGGADTPLEAYLPLMYLNILLPIVAVVGVRGFVRYHRD
jgi:hypothetical protein